MGAQPADGAKIPGIRKWSKELQPKIFDSSQVDLVQSVSQFDAESYARKLAVEEGVFAGISSGGAYYSALRLIERLDEGVVVFIACDRGDRYLSGPVFNESVRTFEEEIA